MSQRKNETKAEYHRRKYLKYEKPRREKKRDEFNAQRRDHYQRNKVKRRKWFAGWYDKNREDQNAKERARNKKEERRAYRRKLMKQKRASDPNFRILQSIRTRVSGLLRGTTKSARTIELLGCDAGFLRLYLEARFEPWMNWGNYGEWHIDHIIPCAEFDLADPKQQKVCFHYTNLRPLRASENVKWREKRPDVHQPEFL